jgi:amino acid adenylation domain-containing protein
MNEMLKLLGKCRTCGIQVGLDDAGQNLRITGKLSTITDELKAELRNGKSELVLFLQEQRAAKQWTIPTGANAEQAFSLAPNQRSIWVYEQYTPDTASYIIPSLYRFEKQGFDELRLKKAIALIVEANEVLRLVLKQDGADVSQQILPEIDLDAHFVTVGFSDAENIEQTFAEAIEKQFNAELPIHDSPLWDVTLYKLGDNAYAFFLRMHHIISDGWSLKILIERILTAYESETVETPTLQYADYVQWITNRDNFKSAQNFWKKELADRGEDLQLSSDFSGETENVVSGKKIKHDFAPELVQKINQFRVENRTNLSALATAALGVVLGRRGRTKDFIIGIPVAGRNHPQLESTIGNFVNTLPVRLQPNSESSFQDFVAQVQSKYVQVLEHQQYPFEYILEDIQYQQEAGRFPLFNVMLSLPNTQKVDLKSEEETEDALESNASLYDLTVILLEGDEELQLMVEYNTAKFSSDTANCIAKEILQVLSTGLLDHTAPLHSIKVMSAKEEQQLLNEFSNAGQEISGVPVTSLHAFEKHLEKQADACAIITPDKALSYVELNEGSTTIAASLQANGVSKGDCVIVQLPRTEKVLEAMLAIWKCGAVYVPVDLSLPEQRKALILEDCKPKVIVNEAFLSSSDQTDKSNFVRVELGGEDLAYLLYTSGTTGVPKAVQVTHSNLSHKMTEEVNLLNADAELTTIQVTSSIFDVSFLEFILPMHTGGKVVIPSAEVASDPKGLLDLMERCGVTMLQGTPTFFAHLAHDDYASAFSALNNTLKHCCIGGESLNAKLVERLRTVLPSVTINNHYGPTEITIDAVVAPNVQAFEKNCIGRPFGTTTAYVLDEHLHLVPIGTPGELCIGGPSVASGYLNQPELTEEKFINHPFIAGEKLYRTGDLVRWTTDGEIEFFGRFDEQVKLRGFRIELQEVNHALMQIEGVTGALTKVIDEQLIAWIEADQTEIDEIKELLRANLPEYMVPANIMNVGRFPMTINGKIDVAQLPKQTEEAEHQSPISENEKLLAQIWSEVLEVEEIGLQSDFFRLGGHSLKIIRLQGKIEEAFGKKISLSDLFQFTSIQTQLKCIETASNSSVSQIPIVEIQENYTVSAGQERLWFLSKLSGGNSAYNIPAAFELDSDVKPDEISATLNFLVNRHEILRTVFVENENGELRQHIHTIEDAQIPLETVEVSTQLELEKSVEKLFNTDFNLETGPLLKAALIRQGSEGSVMAFVMHHIISDGESMKVLMREMQTAYQALSNGLEPVLPVLPIQFKDYAAWQRDETQKGEHLEYWTAQFAGDIPVLQLPARKTRPVIKTYNGATLKSQFDGPTSTAFQQLLEGQSSTLFMGLLATVNVLLHRYSGDSDIVIGSPIAGRTHSNLSDQIGFFANTLALRSKVEPEQSFKALLAEVKSLTLGAYEHQELPFDTLVNALDIPRDPSRTPLFDVMVSVLDEEGETADQQLSVEQSTAKFDLTFAFAPTGGGIDFFVEYNSDVFEEIEVERLTSHMQVLLGSIVQNPAQAIAELQLITAPEQKQLLTDFQGESVDYPRQSNWVKEFEQKCEESDNASALQVADTKHSSADVNSAANQLAAFLNAQYGVASGQFIGVKLERTASLPIAMIAVLKLGAAYVPIDPAYPATRIEHIEKDSACSLVIDQVLIDEFEAKRTEYASENQNIEISSEAPAYVIYTSGSTGKPKGVVISHANLNAFVNWAQNAYESVSYETVFAATSVCFDLSIFELFFHLLGDKKIVLLNSALDIPAQVAQEEKVMLNTVPSVLAELLQTDMAWQNISAVNTAGEALPEGVKNALLERNIVLTNLYGPSETTTYSTAKRFADASEEITIGNPISNTTLHILNEAMHLQPLGVLGEICIGGDGLSLGYLNQPELSVERFVADPFNEGKKLYKTGDLGAWLPNGEIALVGRNDFQVKIRGHRIELEEIEFQMEAHAAINQAVVAALEIGGQLELVAYFTSDQEEMIDFRDYLKDLLPNYMIPSAFMQLDTMPLTANGKLNRNALPAPDAAHNLNATEKVPATTLLQKELQRLWAEVLDINPESIGIHDSFFEVGGHSLKITRLQSRIKNEMNREVTLVDLFSATTIADQEALVQDAEMHVASKIEKVSEQADYPLSNAQQRLWVLAQTPEGNVAYNMPALFEFTGNVDTDHMQAAFEYVIQRHEILRTVFRANGSGEIRQVILPAQTLNFQLEVRDLQAVSGAKERALTEIEQFCLKAFSLENGPLISAASYKVSSAKTLFVYNMHHIISDGWSVTVFLQELIQAYAELSQGVLPASSPLPIQYKDYSAWLDKELSGEALEAYRGHWTSKLEGEIPTLDFPLDRSRKAIKTYNGAMLQSSIKTETTQLLNRYVQEHDGTLFMGLLAAFKAFASRYTGQNDVLVGSPIAGRENFELENQIGFYVNTLALRTSVQTDDRFSTLFDRVRETCLHAYAHQVYPFDKLVDEIGLRRDPSRSPLFDVMVVMQNNEQATAHVLDGALSIQPYALDCTDSKFDLTVTFVEQADGIDFIFEYNTDLFDASSIQRWMADFETIVEGLVQQPELLIRELDYMSDQEQNVLLKEFNNTATTFPEQQSIVQMFETQVQETPDAIALVFDDKSYTYAQLNTTSNQLAHYLIEEQKVTAGHFVGVQLDRSEWMVIAILAALKTGNAYVPIDPEYPSDRIAYMRADSQCKVVVDAALLQEFHKVKADVETSNLKLESTPESAVYMIYTSGSTGAPKGVVMPNSSMINLMQSQFEELNTVGKKVMQFTSVSFDVSFQEIFFTLLSGRTLHVIPRHLRADAKGLIEFVSDSALEVLFLPTAFLKFLMNEAQLLKQLPSSVGHIITAGEQLIVTSNFENLLREKNIVLHNHYGPAEAHVVTTLSMDANVKQIPTIPSIGRPIANTEMLILDESQKLLPIGVEGELFIAGKCLAKGYHNREDLTNEKFVQHPFKSGERAYRTGDLARWNADGSIDFIGRSDDQVKVRGYRIELGEVTAVLQECPGVEKAVVIARDTDLGTKELLAYIVPTASFIQSEIRTYLSTRMPEYMIPAFLIELDLLPLTSNGKLDKRKLPLPEELGLNDGDEFVAPTSTTEKVLVGVWSKLLGLPETEIGTQHNFFELGGHSLRLTQLMHAIQQNFEVEIGFAALFGHPVLAEQAKLIEQTPKASAKISSIEVREHYPVSKAQKRIWLACQDEESSVAHNMPESFVVKGNLQPLELQQAFEAVIERHEILRTSVFMNEEGDLFQKINPIEESGFDLKVVDFRDNSMTNDDPLLAKLVSDESSRVFDLASGQVLRATLIQLGQEESLLHVVLHHIAGDEWSFQVFFEELLAAYSSLLQQQPAFDENLAIQYKDFSAWEANLLEQNDSISHWKNRYESPVPIMRLPFDQNEEMVSLVGGSHSELIQGDKFAKLKELILATKTSNAVTFTGVLYALLYKYSGTADMIIGMPVAQRENEQLSTQIGPYLNMVPLRLKCDIALSMAGVVDAVKPVVTEAYVHLNCPFDEVTALIEPKAARSMQVVLNVFNNTAVDASQSFETAGLLFEQADTGYSQSKFPLCLYVAELNDAFVIRFEYQSERFNESTIKKMGERFQKLIDTLLDNDEQPLKAIEFETEVVLPQLTRIAR